MPAELISIIHLMSASCKKYKGIIFTDKYGNLINDINEPETDISNHNNI